MSRGTNLSKKFFQNHNDFIQSRRLESASTSELITENVRKSKTLGSEARSHSVRSLLSEPKSKKTVRKRSISPIAPAPEVILKKFYKLYAKLVDQLEAVKDFSVAKENETENLVDLRRQLQRADEFSIRFSRNNLYESKRIINEIKKLTVPSNVESSSPGNYRVLCKKIILAFQSASQSLQTYINYSKNPSNLEIPEKINELVLLIADLFLCCEHMSLPPNDAYIKHDAVTICNELIAIMKSKLSICEYVEVKETALAKTKGKKPSSETQKSRKYSMYKSKVIPKLKYDMPRKKMCTPSLLNSKSKRNKKFEQKAKITHGIYTQKLNSWEGKDLGNKMVKFESENQQNAENSEKKTPVRKIKFTPREVRSQDDDVETVVQTIGDDDFPTCRLSSQSRETDEESNVSKRNLKQLMLEAIEGLQNPDFIEQKQTLKKLLNSIQNCSKSQPQTPKTERVKVLNVISKDLQEEMDKKLQKLEEKIEMIDKKEAIVEQEETQSSNKVIPEKRRLKNLFKPVKAANEEGALREAAGNGKLQLLISKETMNTVLKYKKAFTEYRRNNIMYKATLANKPWELIGKVADIIILDIIKEISKDFENDSLIKRLYLNELLEVMS